MPQEAAERTGLRVGVYKQALQNDERPFQDAEARPGPGAKGKEFTGVDDVE